MRTPCGVFRRALGLALVVLSAGTSHAYFLDKARNFDVRLHSYTQLGIMTDSAESDWPGVDPLIPGSQSPSDNIKGESFTFNDENKNARHIYGKRNRINELYLNYKSGPLTLRAGRQSISWGESDDIVFMDRLNAFDLTLGAPGFFQDLDEARIPFWALRATYKIAERWNWLSSVFGEAFVVPGVVDTTVPIDPMVGGVSPFSPDVADPQLLANDLIRRNGFDPRNFQGVHLVVVSRQPEQTWSNTRWGAKLTGVVARDYTVNAWFAREFPVAPVPLLTGAPSAFDDGFKDTGPFKSV